MYIYIYIYGRRQACAAACAAARAAARAAQGLRCRAWQPWQHMHTRAGMAAHAYARNAGVPGLDPMPEGTLKMRLMFLNGHTKS